jgi:uncharacterized protein YmfQ (DUF2313 family)
MSADPNNPLIPRDRHMRRSGLDYLSAFISLLPWGIAWPRDSEGVAYYVKKGLNNFWGYVDGRAADLLERESDPRKTIELLPDWERAWGLPDPCFPKATTIAERQKMLVLYMTWMGGQSRKYFTDLMAYLGFTIEIKEWAPFMAGVSQAGETRPLKADGTLDTSKNFRWYIGPPEMRFAWSANVGQVSVSWFRAASGQAGIDPHLRMGVPEDLQCLLNRWKPAHTVLVFDFSQSPATTDPMYGTP